MAEIVSNNIKPKPRLVPLWFWIGGMGIFIKITHNNMKRRIVLSILTATVLLALFGVFALTTRVV